MISAAKVVIGAVTAVICGRAHRDRRGWSPLAESPGPWPGPQPLAVLVPPARESPACATEIAIATGDARAALSCPACRCARCDGRVAEAAGPAVLTVLAVPRRAHSERDVLAVTDV